MTSTRITPEGKNEDDFTDFWDPNSYNPLDSVEDLSSEQLKAWDFLQSRNDPKSTSNVKKSDESTKLATLLKLMWSASTKYFPLYPSAFTAASASLRVS